MKRTEEIERLYARAEFLESEISCPWCDEYIIESAAGSEICPGCNEKLPEGKWVAFTE